MTSTPRRILTQDQIGAFIADGFLKVPGLFSAALVDQILPMVWQDLEIDPNDCGSWKQPSVILEKVFETPTVTQMYSQRYFAVIDELCGHGRWQTTSGAGHWPIRFPGFDNAPWVPPQEGWHVDGLLEHFQPGARRYGLTGLELFSDIQAAEGGTVVRIGSHRDTARMLRSVKPQGLSERELEQRFTIASQHRPTYELTGQPGDVFFMHPYLVHAAGANTGSKIRILSHKPVWFRHPMDLNRPDTEAYSPIERAVLEAVPELA